MTKRAASYDIDPLTFEEKERTNEKDNPIDPEGAHMRNRKIYKLKKRDNPSESKPEAKLTFTIPGLSDNQESKPKEKQQSPKSEANPFKPSFFGSSSNGTGLFDNLFSKFQSNKDQGEGQKKEESAISSIFANDVSEKPKSSLLGSFGSLFGSQTPSTTSGLLFGGSTGLFNNATQSKVPVPNESSARDNDDGEEEGDSAELERRQTMDVDPSKSNVKFEYKEDCKILKAVKLSKFKKDKGDLVDNPMKISLLEDNVTKTVYIVVQVLATTKSIFSGIILPGKSQVRILNNKAENIEILAFTIESKEKKLGRHVMKIQIINENEADSQEFYEQLKQVIERKQAEKVE